MNRGPDSDDWFDEPDLEDRAPSGVGSREDTGAFADDWLSEENASPLRPSWAAGIDRRLVLLAALLLVLLLAGLAAAGVFSGSGTKATTTISSPTVTRQATTATTAPPARSLPPPPATTLKPGDSGTQVAALQRALASLGFSSGKVDSQYGPATKDAVARFQRSAGLTADGVVGPATLRALTRALRGP